ncbi:mCG145015 [Mus musculus]|nr:mCG145015 [Mus musculus]
MCLHSLILFYRMSYLNSIKGDGPLSEASPFPIYHISFPHLLTVLRLLSEGPKTSGRAFNTDLGLYLGHDIYTRLPLFTAWVSSVISGFFTGSVLYHPLFWGHSVLGIVSAAGTSDSKSVIQPNFYPSLTLSNLQLSISAWMSLWNPGHGIGPPPYHHLMHFGEWSF